MAPISSSSAPGSPHDRRRRSRSLRSSAIRFRHPLLEARLVDVSRSGLGVETSRGLPIGDTLHLEIGAPESARRLEAVVRWCRLWRTESLDNGDVAPRFLAGLEILRG